MRFLKNERLNSIICNYEIIMNAKIDNFRCAQLRTGEVITFTDSALCGKGHMTSH